MDDSSQRDGPHHHHYSDHHHQQQSQPPQQFYDHSQPPPPTTTIEQTSQLYVPQEEGEGGHQLRELFNQFEPHNLGPISANQNPIKRKSRLGSSSSLAIPCTEPVRQKSSMGDTQQISTRSALRRAGVGEIVEVQGGHIIRATGRKDRHSKVCTAKGPRDRRVRLSAHTAIQFYDVQDRLGYDRPSKAVDWLIKKAKAAIDELEQLPAWSPSTMNMSSTSNRRGRGRGGVVEAEDDESGPASGGSNKLVEAQAQAQAQCEEQQQQNMYNSCHGSTFSLLPPSLDSDSIADTIKSFFPMGGPTHEVEPGATITSSASQSHHLQFQDYSHGGLLPRSGNSSSVRQSQDLRLSLQSFQDPMLIHSHHHQAAHDGQQSLFPGPTSIGFGNPNVGWVQPNPEFGRLHRLMVGWNDDSGTENQSAGGVNSSGGGNSGRVGFVFNSQPLLQPLFSGHHSQFFTQREPLQSSNTPSIRAWNNDPSSVANTSEHQTISIHPHAFSGIGFGSGGFSGFHIPARIQGEEEHDGDPNKPSSASSGSCH